MTNQELLDKLDQELSKVNCDRDAHSHIIRILQAFKQQLASSEEKE